MVDEGRVEGYIRGLLDVGWVVGGLVNFWQVGG